eukprot:9240181-Pyramimonas_sp.AAC.1
MCHCDAAACLCLYSDANYPLSSTVFSGPSVKVVSPVVVACRNAHPLISSSGIASNLPPRTLITRQLL